MSHVIWPDWKIRAYLAGQVTQFRVPVKPQPPAHWSLPPMRLIEGWLTRYGDLAEKHTRCPYEPGETVCAKEAYCIESNHNIDDESAYPPPWSDGRPVKWYENDRDGHYWEQAHYKATDSPPELSCDGSSEPACHWKSPATMPQWASRINPLITSVKVEELGKISVEDAIGEGFPIGEIPAGELARLDRSYAQLNDITGSVPRSPIVDWFRGGWDSTHKTGQRFADGIYVWAVTIERTE